MLLFCTIGYKVSISIIDMFLNFDLSLILGKSSGKADYPLLWRGQKGYEIEVKISKLIHRCKFEKHINNNCHLLIDTMHYKLYFGDTTIIPKQLI